MPATADSTPYWRLSAYYFFYFATLGALLPYWGPYLQTRGYDAVAIGELMAIVAGTKVIAPYIWGWIADHSGKRLWMIRLASLVAAVSFAGVFWANTFVLMALVMLLFSFFWNAGLPQFEATTLNYLGTQHHRYSRIRVWGSIGFICTVVLLGPVLDEYGNLVLPGILLVLYGAICLSTLCVPNAERLQPHSVAGQSILSVLSQRSVLVILLACFLMQLSFGPYYTFFSIYLEAAAYSKSVIGVLWALGVLAEVVIFLFMYRLLPALGAKRLLVWCFLLAAVRWLLIAYGVESIVVIVFAQILHAFSFGVFHAVMIHMVHQFFQGFHQGRGQALYSSLSFGAGGALGSFLSGHIWQAQGPAFTYSLSALVALLGAVVVWLGLGSQKSLATESTEQH